MRVHTALLQSTGRHIQSAPRREHRALDVLQGCTWCSGVLLQRCLQCAHVTAQVFCTHFDGTFESLPLCAARGKRTRGCCLLSLKGSMLSCCCGLLCCDGLLCCLLGVLHRSTGRGVEPHLIHDDVKTHARLREGGSKGLGRTEARSARRGRLLEHEFGFTLFHRAPRGRHSTRAKESGQTPCPRAAGRAVASVSLRPRAGLIGQSL